jgi:holo-[acyl-carrier protein] synthase
MQHIGVDIIEINRVMEVTRKWGETFLLRVFTTSELKSYRERQSSLAARFAAKEAVLKALGACDRGISWQDIEILTENNGKPIVKLSGKAREAARELGITEMSVSLSHSKEYAVAFAVAVTG